MGNLEEVSQRTYMQSPWTQTADISVAEGQRLGVCIDEWRIGAGAG